MNTPTPAEALRGSYGFTCGYCNAMLDTPFDDAPRAEQFAHQQGWRMTFGHTDAWGGNVHNTCPDCIAPGEETIPLCSPVLAALTPQTDAPKEP